MKTITAAEANRQFSSILRQVANGEAFTVLSRGRAVASITTFSEGEVERQSAKKSLMARLHSKSASGSRHWTRGELYDH
jgi:antitoxin (DNA-binding transcriptional repressor) of toxin-antitoxin stability system